MLINFLAYLWHQATRNEETCLAQTVPVIRPTPGHRQNRHVLPARLRHRFKDAVFIERHEEQRGVSNHLHWPGGASGVTLGPGYDMRDRSRAEVEQKLRDIGINSSLVSRVAAGAGLRGEAARKFARDNKNLVNLTDDQQRRLLQVNLPSYEAIVRRGIHVYLTQNEFNALVSFVYNPGRGWPGVRAAINSGDKRKAVQIIEKQVRSKGKIMNGLVKRRHDEAMLLLEG